MIETHAHLDFPQYDSDRSAVIKRARDMGVRSIVNVGSSLQGSISSVKLADEYDFIYAACGVHPHEAKEVNADTIKSIRELIGSTKKAVAIGEVGIDFYRNISPKEAQREVFARFCHMSRESGLPLIIHCREAGACQSEAAEALFDIMKQFLDVPYKAVMHCFSGNQALLKRCLDAGFYISYTCNITYKNAEALRESLKNTPLDRLMLETDSPYLSPSAKRGTRNEPAYLKYLLESISEIMSINVKDIEQATDRNAERFFSINP